MKSAMLISLYGLGFFALLVIAVVGTLLWARNLAQKHSKVLYKVRNPKGIDTLDPVEIGDLKQWLHIRGRNVDNPILLFIHGGPGLPHIGWYDEMQRPWEDYFTVVQWDQRQVGKSYLPSKKIAHTLNNERMIADAKEVVDYLLSRFNKEKIFVMGSSYGSYLGIKIAKEKPECLYAYIGVGQIVNVVESIREEHALLLNHIRKDNNSELVTKLEAMMPRPDPDNRVGSFMEHLGRIGKELARLGKFDMDPADLFFMMKFGFLTSPHYNLPDLINFYFGDPYPAFSSPGSVFGEEFMDIDLPSEVGSSFDVPIIFMTGVHDWHVPYTLTDAWFQEIKAPHKEQVWFEDSSHIPSYTVPGKFLVALVAKVLPLAQGKH